MNAKKTKVIFRKWKEGSVIALFPEIPADSTGFAMHSYMHVGQHGACRYPSEADLYNELASPAEYAELYNELEKIGYNLKVIKRATYRHFLTRKNVLKKSAFGRPCEWHHTSLWYNTTDIERKEQ